MAEHAALIAALILDRPTCLNCVATKSDKSLPGVMAYLKRIRETVTVREEPADRCRVCGSTAHVISIGGRASSPAHPIP